KAKPTRDRYGYRAIARPGFKKAMTRSEREELLALLDKGLYGEATLLDSMQQVIDAVADTDCVIIGGGGNLNDQGEHHIFDRIALSRIANRLGKPVVVSSQTVGPALGPRMN